MADTGKTNDLSDLVVDKDEKEKKDNKKRKIIIIASGVIIIALIVLGVMKYMNIGFGSAEKKENKIPNLSTPIPVSTPIKNPTAENSDNLNVDAKKDLEAPKNEPIDENIEPLDAPKEEPTATNPEPTEPIAEPTEPDTEPIVVEKGDSKDIDTIVDDIKDDVVLDDNKKVEEDVLEAPSKKPTPAPRLAFDHAAKKANLASGYYIQVSANQRFKPAKSFINRLKNEGYEVHILEVRVRGVNTRKVLVGPYTSKSEAKDVLETLRETRDDAFIYRVR